MFSENRKSKGKELKFIKSHYVLGTNFKLYMPYLT